LYIFIVKCQQRLEQFCEDGHQWFSHHMGIRRQTPTTRRFGSSSFIPSTCNVQGPEHSTMSYPNPKEAPNAFLDHLKSLDLDSAVVAFLHDQTRPSQQPNGRLDEVKAHEWCNRMDSLLVRHFFIYICWTLTICRESSIARSPHTRLTRTFASCWADCARTP
jgi:hypothetical protein